MSVGTGGLQSRKTLQIRTFSIVRQVFAYFFYERFLDFDNKKKEKAVEMIEEILKIGRIILSTISESEGILERKYCNTVAECSLNLTHDELIRLCREFWNDSMIEKVMDYVLQWRFNWRYFVLGIGNTVAYPIQDFILRLLTHQNFVHFLVTYVNPSYGNTPQVSHEGQALELVVWIVANVLQGLEGFTPVELRSIVPNLVELCHPIFSGKRKISFSFTSAIEAKLDQLHVRNFRSLCAVFSSREIRELYPTEYQVFLKAFLEIPSLTQYLLLEYKLGLEGEGIEAISFFPDAYQRALTVYFLTQIEGGTSLLVHFGVIHLLTRSLFTKMTQSEVPTSLLWSRSIRILYKIASNRQYHPLLLDNENIHSVIYAATYREEIPRLSLQERKLAAEIVVILRLKWRIERLFWIAQKESSKTCPVSRLPSVLIKPIMQWVILFENASDYEEKYSKEIMNGYAKK